MNISPSKMNDLFNIDDDDQPSSGNASAQPRIDGGSLGCNAMAEDCKKEVSIDYAKAYNEFADLIKIGKEMLEGAKIVIESNPDDSKSVAAAASMMSTLNSLVAQFTKLHVGNLNHEHKKEIELIKINAKKELLELKIMEAKRLAAGDDGQKKIGSPEGPRKDDTVMVPFCQEDVISRIVERERNLVKALPK